MTHTLRILPAADRDIDEAARFIALDSLDHALRQYDSVEMTFKMLSEHPHQWPLFGLDHPSLQDIRRCWVSGFRNFLVFSACNTTSSKWFAYSMEHGTLRRFCMSTHPMKRVELHTSMSLAADDTNPEWSPGVLEGAAQSWDIEACPGREA